ncbi:MAG: tryptophan synthase subunit alpha [Nitrospirales bacterium]|nr:tryptophan synthase subunit alpha [Nitrospirales bacterium]
MKHRIAQTFQLLKEKHEKALIPYVMAGDPSLRQTEELVLELERNGANLIELGVPFSDPIADGPVIQLAAERALRSGTSLKKILAMVKRLRQKTQIPLILMAYYNTLMAMGEEPFCREAVAVGIDGVIIPDMPPEESKVLSTAATTHGLDVIFLLAPTSTALRKQEVIKRARGFIYYVSLTGITGFPLSNIGKVQTHVRHIQKTAKKPVAVGFGIATPHEAKAVSQFADGVIVGSAIVRQIGAAAQSSHLVKHIGSFIKKLKHAMT